MVIGAVEKGIQGDRERAGRKPHPAGHWSRARGPAGGGLWGQGSLGPGGAVQRPRGSGLEEQHSSQSGWDRVARGYGQGMERERRGAQICGLGHDEDFSCCCVGGRPWLCLEQRTSSLVQPNTDTLHRRLETRSGQGEQSQLR